jgi:hypothetical protein
MEIGEPSGDLVAAVRADPILASFAPALERYARPSIRLIPDPSAPRYIGESRVGGSPAVPPGFEWPRRHVDMPRPSEAWLASSSWPERVLPPDETSTFGFIAQIDLAAVAAFDLDGVLPPSGLLLFFYDEFFSSDIDPDAGWAPSSSSTSRDGQTFAVSTFGFDQTDQVRVIHVPDGIPLELGTRGPVTANALPLVPVQDWTLPNGDTPMLARVDEKRAGSSDVVTLPTEAWERFHDIEYRVRLKADLDQMLGWADNGAHGPSFAPDLQGSLSSMPLTDLIHACLDARLLLQLSLPTYERAGIEFGRTLYFYARESDLHRGDFSRAWYDSD